MQPLCSWGWGGVTDLHRTCLFLAFLHSLSPLAFHLSMKHGGGWTFLIVEGLTTTRTVITANRRPGSRFTGAVLERPAPHMWPLPPLSDFWEVIVCNFTDELNFRITCSIFHQRCNEGPHHRPHRARGN